jgi:integrase
MSPSTLLQEAGDLFLERQRQVCRRATIESNEGHVKRLVEFFGNIPLAQFTIAHFEHYQQERRKKAGCSAVNHELNTLGRILRRVDLWYEIKRNYTPLKETAWKAPRIFTASEQERIFRALKNNPNLELAEIVFTITRNTTASGCELRGLRLRSLELDADPPRMHIEPDSTKNNIRPRTIPLNDDALRACMRAVDRAKRLGCHYPENYLFPLSLHRAGFDRTSPASKSWLRKQVQLLREVTGIAHINPHTFRHLAVTELLEQGAPEQTVIAIAGWVGRRMVETYSHTRIEAKQDALGLLSSGGYRRPNKRPDEMQERVDLLSKTMEQTNTVSHNTTPTHAAAPPTAPALDLMHPAVQAEIERQVALALQRERGQAEVERRAAEALQREREQSQARFALEPPPSGKGPRVLRFPGAG